jgi:hypothetical protein
MENIQLPALDCNQKIYYSAVLWHVTELQKENLSLGKEEIMWTLIDRASKEVMFRLLNNLPLQE